MSQPASRPGLPLGRVAGVPVYLSGSWLLIVLLVLATFSPQIERQVPGIGAGSYLVALAYVLLLLLSVLAHELAHAAVGRWEGLAVERVVLDFWGGHTVHRADGMRPRSAALTAVVGPLANLAVAGLGTVALPWAEGDVVRLLLTAVIWANVFVGGFNLLPGLPLDGGHILSAGVWALTGSEAAGLRVAGWTGRLLTGVVLAWYVVLPWLAQGQVSGSVGWGLLIAWFLWRGASSALSYADFLRRSSRRTIGEFWRPVVAVAPGTSLAHAAQLLAAAGTRAELAVVDSRREWRGVVPDDALAAAGQSGTLDEITVDQVLARVDSEATLSGAPSSPVTELLRLMAERHTTVVGVTDPSGRLVALVRAKDIDL